MHHQSIKCVTCRTIVIQKDKLFKQGRQFFSAQRIKVQSVAWSKNPKTVGSMLHLPAMATRLPDLTTWKFKWTLSKMTHQCLYQGLTACNFLQAFPQKLQNCKSNATSFQNSSSKIWFQQIITTYESVTFFLFSLCRVMICIWKTPNRISYLEAILCCGDCRFPTTWRLWGPIKAVLGSRPLVCQGNSQRPQA